MITNFSTERRNESPFTGDLTWGSSPSATIRGFGVRGCRDLRDEFSTFHALAYPQLAAQTLAITGDAEITRTATDTTLARVWRSWSSVRRTGDLLVRARWTAVLVAAERESTAPSVANHAGDAIQAALGQLTAKAEVAADVVVLAALQRLPRVQRRALVLHYMGGVSVRHLAALSGSSAEHVELLLDDGFTALADSLEWSAPDDTDPDAAPIGADGPDLSFDWVAEALADTAARLPEQIPAPLPTRLLRNATAVRWSIRAIAVAAGAACAAVIAAVAQPSPPELPVQAAYAAHGSHTAGGPLGARGPDIAEGVGPQADPPIPMRSVALTALLDTPARLMGSGRVR
jgi:RNA polymerase sigma-70 factor, ECF subfamily